MTPFLIRAAFGALVVLASTSPVRAQSADARDDQASSAGASMVILRSLHLSASGPVILRVGAGGGGGLMASGGTTVDTPAVIQVRGDPNRVYRIRLPEPADGGAGAVETLSILSDNAGDISTSRASHLDATGQDVLRIEGRMLAAPSAGGGLAVLPLSLDYE